MICDARLGCVRHAIGSPRTTSWRHSRTRCASQHLERKGGAFAGMVIGYWEQACALLNYGLLHEDLFFETSGEFFWGLGACQAHHPRSSRAIRGQGVPGAPERAAQRYERWSERRTPGHLLPYGNSCSRYAFSPQHQRKCDLDEVMQHDGAIECLTPPVRSRVWRGLRFAAPSDGKWLVNQWFSGHPTKEEL